MRRPAYVLTVDLRPAPVLTLDLSSQLVAWGLQRASLPSFVRVSGRQVQIRLAEIPALQEAAAFWPHVEHITCASTTDGLEISAALHAAGTPAATTSARRRVDGPPVERAGVTAGGSRRGCVINSPRGLPALAGARLAGTVPVPVDVLNEWVAAAMTDWRPLGRPNPVRRRCQGLDRARVASWVRRVRVDATPA